MVHNLSIYHIYTNKTIPPPLSPGLSPIVGPGQPALLPSSPRQRVPAVLGGPVCPVLSSGVGGSSVLSPRIGWGSVLSPGVGRTRVVWGLVGKVVIRPWVVYRVFLPGTIPGLWVGLVHVVGGEVAIHVMVGGWVLVFRSFLSS